MNGATASFKTPIPVGSGLSLLCRREQSNLNMLREPLAQGCSHLNGNALFAVDLSRTRRIGSKLAREQSVAFQQSVHDLKR
jgi:hypothetical protein